MRSMLAMNKVLGILVAFGVLGICAMADAGEESSILVFSEPGFPAAILPRQPSCS